MIYVAMLWLANEDGELLLARRADHKATDPGLWGPSVTGKLEPGETAKEALLRETEEELGLEAAKYIPIHLLDTDFNHPDGKTRRFYIYWATINKHAADSIVIDINEVAETKWYTVNEIRQLLKTRPGDILVYSARALWEKVLEAIESSLLKS